MKRAIKIWYCITLCTILLLGCNQRNDGFADHEIVFHQDNCTIEAIGTDSIRSIRVTEQRAFGEPPVIDTSFKKGIKIYHLCNYYDYKNKRHSPFVNGLIIQVGTGEDSTCGSPLWIDVNKTDSANKSIEGYRPGK